MSKLNIVVRLQHWMDSVPGQTFLNYAYSWGAAIVILGALFKLTHLPGGNFMLFIGMGTEAVVFFLAAFDRPFDKQEIDKELAHDFESDEEIERAEGWEATSDLAVCLGRCCAKPNRSHGDFCCRWRDCWGFGHRDCCGRWHFCFSVFYFSYSCGFAHGRSRNARCTASNRCIRTFRLPRRYCHRGKRSRQAGHHHPIGQR